MLQPVIKWSGSKRPQAETIVSYFPKSINTYYEPFCTGTSVLNALLCSEIEVKRYICSDINSDLINLWNEIKSNPKSLVSYYDTLWHEMNDNVDDSQNFKKDFYNKVRERYNIFRDPHDFLFLDRTCFNGLIRYNLNKEFNSPYHIRRNGITPDKRGKIIYEWSEMLNVNNVIFVCHSYKDIITTDNDFLYLDPPYANTNGMYYNHFDNDEFFKWLKNVKCRWALSYNGISGKEDNTVELPNELYSRHEYLKSGNSSFKRIKNVDDKAIVYESLYIKL